MGRRKMDYATNSTMISMTNQAIHSFNNTASHFQTHPSAMGSIGLPIAAALGFMYGLAFGLRRG
jgi:hypothetical protein